EACGAGGCTVNNGEDTCNPDPCTCPGTGFAPVCGHELPSSCGANPNTIYICRGGSGTKPEELSECVPGTQCIKKATPEGAVCGSGTCDCKGDNEVCSNQFPDSCGLEKNTIYKCTSDGKPEKVKACDASKSCVVLDDGAVCSSNDCKCPDDGTVCGRVFPLSCKIKTSALYTCKKGGDPVFEKDCAPDRCSASKASFAAAAIFEATATDVCVDSCTCVGKGPACGSTFNPKCKLKASTLYKCDGSGSAPTEGEECGAGGCTVNNGEDTCNPDPCTCPGTGFAPVCGSELPLSCGAKANTIYHCPGGSGTKPEELSNCKPGTQCVKKATPEGAVCGAGTCDCKGDNEVCSNQFPDNCGLEKNTIYKCTSDGKPEKVKSCDASKSCVVLDDGAVCASNDCKCPDDGTVCGQVFPLSCKIKTSALYTCKKGEDPVFEKDCAPDRCSASKASFAAAAIFEATATDVCVDGCTCADKGPVCGSTFDPKCKLDASTLYKCDGSGTTPTEGEACGAGGCTVTNGDDTCNPVDCTCPGSGTAPVCGSALPKECGADANTIYMCPGGSGTAPVPLKICDPGTICRKVDLPNGAICGAGGCECDGEEEVCSDAFDKECNLAPNSIYKCNKDGTPTKTESCDATQSCVSLADGAMCASDDCKCPSDGTVCGQVFPLSCKLKTTALYTCKKGGDPVLESDCYPKRCSASKASFAAAAVFEATAADVCVGQCTCAKQGDVCGSTFPPECNKDPATLYKCDGGAGSEPTVGEECKEGGCKVSHGNDKCSNNKCTCPAPGTDPVCGADLPAECKAKAGEIYHCPGGTGSEPKVLEVCEPGTVCIKKESPEGAVCGSGNCDCKGDNEVCSNQFPDKCGLEKNTIYKCTSDGKPEKVKSCDATKSCVASGGDAHCVNNDCKCEVDGVVCGKAFPLSCKLSTTALYTCKKGDSPKIKQDCHPGGRCNASADSFAAAAIFEALDDVCVNDCNCASPGPACGHTFPDHCNLDSAALYSCSGSGSEPKELEKCTKGGCVSSNGDDKCSTDVCTCPSGTDPVCGADLPSACNAKSNTIYHCPGGTGTAPEPLSECLPGTMCIKKPSPQGAVCGAGTCDCTGSNEVCSDQFPDKCGYEKNAVLKCNSDGKPTKVKDCKGTETCVSLGDEAECATNDCKCPSDGIVCGQVFPLSCKIKTSALYTCKKGEDPVFEKDCDPDRCSASKASFAAAAVFEATATDVCTNQCSCPGKGPVCGSTFDPECKLEPSTLYNCDGSGSTPTQGEVCGQGGCTVNNGNDKCNPTDCTCPGTGLAPVCGAELPSSCKAKANTIYHCPGGSGTIPEELSVCKAGSQCIKKPLPEGAICGAGDCECKGDQVVCSNQFLDSCGYPKNAVLKCTPGGTPEKVEDCGDDETCVKISDGAICTKNDCKCPEEGTICGEVFPLSCKIKTTALYTCTKGSDPVLQKDCAPGTCSATKASMGAKAVFEAAAVADKCDDKCTCAGNGPACGSTFDPECKLEPSSLYSCSGNGATPVEGEKCKEGGCTVTNGDDKCNPDPCTCPGSGTAPVCGSELPLACHALANTIYHCPGGSGTKPVPLSDCKPGTMCIKKATPEGAVCGSGDCECKGSNEVCSNQFPDNCGLEKNTIYKCTSDGKPEKVKTCDATKSCVVLDDGAVCASNDCKCPDDGTVCGQVFPLSCKIRTTALYTCTKGGDPVLQKECAPGFCTSTKATLAAAAVFEASATDVCTEACKCTSPGPVCGSTFNPECKLEASTLYKCDGSGSTPTEDKVCGSGGCTVTNGDDTCNPVKCTCPGSGTAPVCGAELPKECNAKANVIYHCPGGSGTVPEELSVCKPGTQCIKKPLPEGAVCGSADCECKGDNEVCSNQFDDSCNLEKNTIYKCTPGGKPEKVKTCDATKSCVAVDDGAGCGSNDCKCPDDGTVCGQVFPLSCKIKTSALYTCKKGEDPVFEKDCSPDRCSASKASFAAAAIFEATATDVCTSRCECPSKGPVCGSSFDPDCKLETNALYNCDGKGSTPVKGEDCKEGGCTVSNGDDKCSTGKCTCPTPGTAPVCGADLPAECNADHTKIYQCPGGTGTEPKVLAVCEPGTVCIKKDSPEGAACGGDDCDCTGGEEVCSSAFKDECGYEKNAIYKCTSDGKAEKVKNCDATESCVKLDDGPVCTSNDCKCPTDGTVCGKVFPLSCKISTTALYTCVKGEAPIHKEDCDPKTCVTNKASMGAAAVFEAAAADDKCSTVDECDCHSKGAACGSTYPDKCGYDKDTIYKCDGATGKPTAGDKCPEGECVVTVGDDKCGKTPPDEKCTCPEGWNSVCGFDLPTECADKIKVEKGAVYFCPGGKGTLPEVQKICPSGLTCQSKEEPEGAACGGTDCECKGKAELCSDAFPVDCGLKPNTIYKCSSTGVPEEVETCPEGKACIILGDESACAPTDCKCHSNGLVCGEAFPPSCKLKATALYKCEDGKNPELEKDCGPEERCSATKESMGAASAIFRKLADDVCVDPCLCSGEGPACGLSFLDKCGLEQGGLYKCDGKGATPSLIEKCKKDICIIHPGDDSCGDDTACLCIDSDDVCGNAFPSFCKYKTDSVYSCEGAGATPELKEKCASKKCKIEPGNDGCTDDPCACKDETPACGGTFDKSCKLDKGTLYDCSEGKGTKPKVAEKCESGECLEEDEDDGCKPPIIDGCKCKDDKAICGAQYGDECNFDKDTLYTCSGEGADPEESTKCENGCDVRARGNDVCQIGPCDCKRTEKVCASAFGEDCQLEADGLYDCSAKGAKPELEETCKNGCSEAAGNDKCTDEDPCKCKDDTPTCGSEFGASCGLDKDTVYKCDGGKGTDPTPGEACSAGECLVTGGDDGCKPAPPTDCKCRDDKPICGSQYADDCKLDKDTLYTCAGAGVDPTPGAKCDPGACTVSPSGADSCKEDPCKCQDGEAKCGSEFKPECGLNKDTVYKCDGGKGTTPTPGEVCKAGECLAAAGNDGCKPTPPADCKCKDDKDICGKQFSKDCKFLDDTVYKCSSAGADPTPGQVCTNGCSVTPANTSDQCSEGGATGVDCKCQDSDAVCGSAFNVTCNYDAATLYKCDGGKGSDPILKEKCETGVCEAKEGPDACKPPIDDCKCKDGSAVCGKEYKDSCGFDKDTLYTCNAAGGDPAPGEKCQSGCTSNPAAADECTKDPCSCKEAGRVCADALPAECKAVSGAVYLCDAAGSPPKIQKVCEPGKTCVSHADGADCGGTTCKCTGKAIVCSSEFPDNCNLEKNTVYKCTDSGTPNKVKACESGTECVALGDTAFCGPSDCKCPDDGTICGSVFPLSCKLNATSLYTCTKGGAPAFDKDCQPGRCSGKAPAMDAASAVFKARATTDTCVDACICATTDDLVCGNTFPESCNLDKGSLYKCTAPGVAPTEPVKCEGDNCVAQPGLDACGGVVDPTPDCFCKDDQPICLSSLASNCLSLLPADTPKESVLECSGAGAKPTVKEVCKEDQTCKKPDGQPAGCKDLCACEGADTKCSKDFNPICKLPDGVYKCGAEGKPEKVEDCTAPATCHTHPDGPKCTPEECVCKDGAKHCGVAFDPKCALAANTLYTCTDKEIPKVEKECAPGVCSSNNKPTPAPAANETAPETPPAAGSEFSSTAEGEDFCIDQCACKVANEDVCSSLFDAACNFKANTVMHCDAINSAPTEKEACTSECVVLEGNDECKIDPCACRKDGDTCGNFFPPKCNLEANTLYTCAGNKTIPAKKEACDPMSICTQIPGGADICGVTEDCECVGKGPTCSDKFPPGCNYTANSLVLCPNHTAITDCPEGCADGECKTGCKCTGDVAVCGSSFASKCDLVPNALYSCKNGEDPVLEQDCGDQGCIKGIDPNAPPAGGSTTPTNETTTPPDGSTPPTEPAGYLSAAAVQPAKCDNQCLCNDGYKTCGAAFAVSCNLEPKSLYACAGPGSTPTKLEACTESCEFTEPNHHCKLDCAPAVLNMSSQIDVVVEQMELLMTTYILKMNYTDPVTGYNNETPGDYEFNPAGNITLIAYPPFIATLDKIKADMLKDSKRPDKLNLQAGTVLKTLIGAGRVMNGIKPLFPKRNVNASLPLIQDMRDLVPFINDVIACSGGNQSDCSGIIKLWKDFNNAAIERIDQITQVSGANNMTLKNLTIEIQNVTNILDEVFATRNDSTLPEAGFVLNSIIGKITSSDIYQDASNGVNLYFEAAKEALRCEGFNITVFADKCSAYGMRTKGGLANIIIWLKDQLNKIPFFGEYITTPLLEAIENILVSAQDGAFQAVGRVWGMILGVIQIFGLIPTADSTGDSAGSAILRFIGIGDEDGDCGGKGQRCMGLTMIVRLLLDAVVKLLLGWSGLDYYVSWLTGKVIDIIESAASGLISGVALGLKAASIFINMVTLGASTKPLATFVTGLEELARCWITSADENDKEIPPTQSLRSHARTLTMF
ncbi:hypothetical protein EC991_010895, partial [Linnemannia zychae]